MLDLTHLLLSDHDIARFPLKREAAAFASERGRHTLLYGKRRSLVCIGLIRCD